MRKNVLVFFILCFILSFSSIYGQKANTRLVRIGYVQPPISPLPSNIKNYYSKVISRDSKVSINSFGEKLRLMGYQKSYSIDEHDVFIQFIVNSASSSSAVKEVKYQEKINDSTYIDKIGTIYEVTGRVNFNEFFQDVKNNKTLYLNEGKVLEKKLESKMYNTYNEAVKTLNAEKQNHAQSIYNELVLQAIEEFNNGINEKYGFPTKTFGFYIARGKGEKHDYTDLEETYNKFVSICKSYDSQVTDKLTNEVNDCIKIWDNAVKEFNPSKKARIGTKNIGHIHYNLASAYFVLKEWKKVYEHLLIARDTKGVGRVAILLERITKDLEKRHDFNTM